MRHFLMLGLRVGVDTFTKRNQCSAFRQLSRFLENSFSLCWFLIAFLVAQTVKNLPVMQETQVQSLSQGRSPGKGNGNPLQYCCLENPMDRGAWKAMNIGSQRGSTCTSKIQRYKCEEKQTSPCYWLVTLMGNTLWFKKKKIKWINK